MTQLSKRELCERIYSEVVPDGYVWGSNSITDRSNTQLLMRVFQQELGMSEAGARTYVIGCKRVKAGLPFYHTIPSGPRDTTPYDNSPDVEDERDLFTIVYPQDDLANNTCVVGSTHSFYDKESAFKRRIGDAIVVTGLPEIGSNFFELKALAC